MTLPVTDKSTVSGATKAAFPTLLHAIESAGQEMLTPVRTVVDEIEQMYTVCFRVTRHVGDGKIVTTVEEPARRARVVKFGGYVNQKSVRDALETLAACNGTTPGAMPHVYAVQQNDEPWRFWGRTNELVVYDS